MLPLLTILQAQASRDPAIFSNPDSFDLNRDPSLYIYCQGNAHVDTEDAVSKLAMTAMLKTVGKLANLRRAPGEMGILKKVSGEAGDRFMTSDRSSFLMVPESMKVQWDGDLPPLNG